MTAAQSAAWREAVAAAAASDPDSDGNRDRGIEFPREEKRQAARERRVEGETTPELVEYLTAHPGCRGSEIPARLRTAIAWASYRGLVKFVFDRGAYTGRWYAA